MGDKQVMDSAASRQTGETGGGRSRAKLFIVIGLVFLCAAGAGIWKWTRAPATRMRVTLTTDHGESSRILELKVPTAPGAAGPVETTADLGAWEGRLVRLDFQGESGEAAAPGAGGLLAIYAEIASGGKAAPLQFWGWRPDKKFHFHPRKFGSPAFVAPLAKTERGPFIYNDENRHWTVVRVPPRATLRVVSAAFSYLDLEGAPEINRPAAGGLKLPVIDPAEKADARGGRPDVFIYVIDALRADHLSCYGYARETSPNIDAFAREATWFADARTAATWTRPAVASIMTGLYPAVHEVMHRETDALGEWPVLLTEVFQSQGYETAIVATNPNVTRSRGFDQGVEEFRYSYLAEPAWVNRELGAIISANGGAGPLFCYLHTMEPHAPYAPKPQTFARFDRGFAGKCDGSTEALNRVSRFHPDLTPEDTEHLMDLYDAEIADADAGFGEFLEMLRAAGRFDDALIILTADHGEAFLEHGTQGHGCTLNAEEDRVPLIIRFPGGRFAGERIAARASLLDIFPTVVATAAIEARTGYALPGEDLRKIIASERQRERALFGEVSLYADNRADLISVIDEEGYKRVLEVSEVPGRLVAKPSVGLWDTQGDPKEAENLLGSHPVRAAYGEQLIAGWLLGQRGLRRELSDEPRRTIELPEKTREELRALGYLK